MAVLDIAGYDYALKIKYPRQKVEELMYEQCPTFALLSKDTNFYGSSMKIPLAYGAITSISRDFDIAQAAKGSSTGANFLVTRVHKYAIGAIDNETVKASQNDKGAFISASKAEMERTIRTLGQVVSDEVFGDGSGFIGSYASAPAANQIQLANPEDTRHFEAGQVLVYAADAASNLGDAGAQMTVSAVNRSTGVITMTANIAAVWASITADDLIFRYGDYTQANDRLCVSGLAAYLPGSATPAALFGMTRTADPTRLSGVYSNSTLEPGLGEEEVLQLLATEIGREGGKPDLAVVSFTRWRNIVNALGSKVQYGKQTASLKNKADKTVGQMGFDTLRVAGPRGNIDVLADPACPEDKIYMLQKDTWKFASLGPVPTPVLIDGRWVKNDHTNDGIELRAGFYGNLCCSAPAWNGVYTF